nr:reverse transcriptase domain-containing protein [Tanacetum cinerariifolium]
DIGKLGTKGDIGFFIGYLADSYAYRVYNRWTKKIIETMNVSFDELLVMAFEQRNSKPRLQSMTSRHISSGLDLTYAPSTITTQQPSEGKLDLLFKAMYDDYLGGQPSAALRTVSPAQEPQVRQSSTASTTIADTAPIPTNSSSLATNIPITSQNVNELNPYVMVDGNTNKSRLIVRGYRQEEGINFEESFAPDFGFELTRFSDADYAGCKDTFKSTSGRAQFLGENLVSWSLKKQDCTTLSTVETEYVSLSACCAQVLWMRTELTDYGFHFNKIPIYCDSKSAIAISCNSIQHSRTKHIAVRYHFIKEHVEKGTIELYFVKTDYQLVDIFTKALPTYRFSYLVRRLARAKGIFPGTLPLDKVEVLGSDDGVTTSLQLSQNSRPPMLDHQDKYMMKAQVHVLKSFAISDEQPFPQRKYHCQIYQVVKHILRRRLLESFQDREHEGGDTRSQVMEMIRLSDLKGITTRSGTTYQGPTIPTTSSSLPPVVERETEATKDMMPSTNNESTKDIQPLVVETESLILNSEPVVAPIIEPVVAPKLRDKDNDQREKFFQIFKDLNFNNSFTDALVLMPKFSPTIKTLLTNKDKLSVLARTLLNEHCLAVLLKKLPKKLEDPGKFLILCDFSGMAECLALANLGASINLMPFSVWNKLSLPDLSLMCMSLELADRSISCPVGVAEDVFVKVGTFHFPTDFVVVDFDANPRAITFNLDQTSRYSAYYNDMTTNRIDVIDMAYEEYSQEVLSFSDVIANGNPTPCCNPIVSMSFLTLTPFGESDFLLEEVDAFLALEDDPTSPEVDQSYVDTEGNILLLEDFLNDDPSLPPPNQGNYLPQVRKELKICEAKTDKSSIDEPPEVKLKDLPPHLEYAFLEGDDKSPVIIAKDLSVEEKTALITVLKSHKRAIAWKLSDIKGIDLEFYTHKILMEDDFKPTVLHQRRVNPKIHDVIKNEVLKLLDAGLIYSIFDSPWNIFKFTSIRKIKNRPYSHVLMEYLPTVTWLLGYVMHGARFREKILKRCEDTNLGLNWEKSHFMVKEGIVLGHKISKNGIEVDKAKVEIIEKLPHPTTVKGIRSFLCHAGFYRRFIQDFSKIARPMTRLLEKDTLFFFSKECVEAFQTLKRKLTEASILIAPDWDLPFELMCDASDFAIGAVLGQRQEKHFRPIHLC